MDSPLRRTRRVAGVPLLVCVLLVTLLAGSGPSGATPDPPAAALAWRTCPPSVAPTLPGLECTEVTVPANYDSPLGPFTAVTAVRFRSPTQRDRIGTLVVNPGGPGVSAVRYLVAAVRAGSFPTLAERFDLVAFDPRGVGRSGAITCIDPSWLAARAERAQALPDRHDRDAILVDGWTYGHSCLARERPRLSFVSTLYAAEDLERLRQGLGEPVISYLGFSYGTLLGATYAARYPGRLRAAVLDGAVDPDSAINRPLQDDIDRAAAFEAALGRFLTWCGPVCARAVEAPAGAGERELRAAFRDLLRRLDDRPVAGLTPSSGSAATIVPPIGVRPGDTGAVVPTSTTVPSRPRPVDGWQLSNAAVLALHSRQLWPVLAEALASIAEGDGRLAQVMSDVWIGRRADGSLDDVDGPRLAVSCSERAYGNDPGVVDRAYDEFVGASPTFGGLAWSEAFGCITWQARASRRLTGPYRARGAPPLLVVGTTGDTATPYPWAFGLTRALGPSGVLLTMVGEGHTAYGGTSRCVDRAVEDYLVDLVVPQVGTVCEQQPTDDRPVEMPVDRAAPPGSPAPAGPDTAGVADLRGVVDLREVVDRLEAVAATR